ncbi:MAG: DUF1844 domain-containing protein [Candidatus Omnitrophota bacterium]
MDEQKKDIDEGWKEAVEKEKQGLEKEGKFAPEAPDFSFFITTLSLQAAVALGVMPNPATNKIEENTQQAQFIIDTITMLKDKTKGNLTAEEEKLVDNILYELRVQYIAKTQGGAK